MPFAERRSKSSAIVIMVEAGLPTRYVAGALQRLLIMGATATGMAPVLAFVKARHSAACPLGLQRYTGPDSYTGPDLGHSRVNRLQASSCRAPGVEQVGCRDLP